MPSPVRGPRSCGLHLLPRSSFSCSLVVRMSSVENIENGPPLRTRSSQEIGGMHRPAVAVPTLEPGVARHPLLSYESTSPEVRMTNSLLFAYHMPSYTFAGVQ